MWKYALLNGDEVSGMSSVRYSESTSLYFAVLGTITPASRRDCKRTQTPRTSLFLSHGLSNFLFLSEFSPPEFPIRSVGEIWMFSGAGHSHNSQSNLLRCIID